MQHFKSQQGPLKAATINIVVQGPTATKSYIKYIQTCKISGALS